METKNDKITAIQYSIYKTKTTITHHHHKCWNTHEQSERKHKLFFKIPKVVPSVSREEMTSFLVDTIRHWKLWASDRENLPKVAGIVTAAVVVPYIMFRVFRTNSPVSSHSEQEDLQYEDKDTSNTSRRRRRGSVIVGDKDDHSGRLPTIDTLSTPPSSPKVSKTPRDPYQTRSPRQRSSRGTSPQTTPVRTTTQTPTRTPKRSKTPRSPAARSPGGPSLTVSDSTDSRSERKNDAPVLRDQPLRKVGSPKRASPKRGTSPKYQGETSYHRLLLKQRRLKSPSPEKGAGK